MLNLNAMDFWRETYHYFSKTYVGICFLFRISYAWYNCLSTSREYSKYKQPTEVLYEKGVLKNLIKFQVPAGIHMGDFFLLPYIGATELKWAKTLIFYTLISYIIKIPYHHLCPVHRGKFPNMLLMIADCLRHSPRKILILVYKAKI